MQTSRSQILWWNAMNMAKIILDGLSKIPDVEKIEIAGDARRKLETVSDLIFLVVTSTSPSLIAWLNRQEWTQNIKSTKNSKISFQLKSGLPVDIRIIPKEQLPFALLYYTGSKEHYIRLQQIANDLGIFLDEMGMHSHGSQNFSEIHAENEIYNALGLSYIPPELREDRDEIEAAKQQNLPMLITENDIRGIFHCHTLDSDGHNTLEEMAVAAQELGLDYIGFSDHSKSSVQAHGMNEERLFDQVKRIQILNETKHYSVHLFAGVECDILNNGELDFTDSILKELDFVIVSIHRSFKFEEKIMTNRLIKAIENPYTTMIGHLTGRLLLKREPYTINFDKVIDACIANHKVIELNAHPFRLDMDWRYWHKAIEKGLKCSINPDAHSVDDLQFYKAGVHIARKGWLQKKHVITTLSLSEVRDYLKNHK